VSQQETSSTVNQDAPETTPDVSDQSTAEKTADESSELMDARKQAQEYMAGWQRERAEFANYKKRAEREMKDLAQNAAVESLMGLLPIIDDIDRAMTSVPPELKDNPWTSGVGAISRKFQKILDEHGVSVIDPVGEVFDPNRHEAVATEDSSDVESGHITATLQKGYTFGDRVLRPALVRVAN